MKARAITPHCQPQRGKVDRSPSLPRKLSGLPWVIHVNTEMRRWMDVLVGQNWSPK